MQFDISPQISARLTEAAQSRGIDPAKLLENLVAEYLPSAASSSDPAAFRDHFYFTASAKQFQRALDEIARMNRDLPVLSDEALDRENLYEDRL